MAGSIICDIDDSESAKGAAGVARGLSSELGLGPMFVCVAEHGASPTKDRQDGRGTEFAGGIARFGLSGKNDGTEFAGAIVRFGFGSSSD